MHPVTPKHGESLNSSRNVWIDHSTGIEYLGVVEGAQHNIWVRSRKADEGIRCESGTAPQR
jgi:hypothetical protein